MAIGKILSAGSKDKFVVPCAGRLFRVNVSEHNKAVCFCLNKGYFEMTDLGMLLDVMDALDDWKSEYGKGKKLFIPVGRPDKVRLMSTGKVVYRQRLFFRSLSGLLSVMARFGLRFEVMPNFRITINNIINCSEDLKYFERYASEFDETIDTWLTNSCLVHLHRFLVQIRQHSSLDHRVLEVLAGRMGYLDRAPFLALGYGLDKNTSSLFIGGGQDSRAYSVADLDAFKLDFGYTSENLEKDKTGGVFI